MAFEDRIKIVVDFVTDKATASVGSFKAKLGEAEGATGKLKTSFGAAGDFIRTHAAEAALGAGTALVGFAMKSVGEFQNLALEAGRLGESLGIPYEDASRLIEVAGDLGIEVGTVEGAIGRLERQVGTNKTAFEELGVEIAYTKDGTIDANETFLRTMEYLRGIKDPTDKAREAQKLLGRQWQDMAEMIDMDLRPALDSVSDAKVIDAGEVEQARRFRDSLDDLKGKVEDLSLSLGGKLVPALADVFEEADRLSEKLGNLVPEGTGDMLWNQFFPDTGFNRLDSFDKKLGGIAELGPEIAAKAREAGEGVEDLGDDADDASVDVAKLKREMYDAEDAARDMKQAYKYLTDELSNEESYNTAIDAVGELETKLGEAFGAAQTGAEDADEKQRAYRDQLINTKQDVIAWTEQLGNVPASVTSEVLTLLDQGKYDEALAKLQELEKDREAELKVNVRVAGDKGWGGIPVRASGGPVSAGQPYLVGEQGPELVVPDANGMVVNANGTRNMLSGGGTPVGGMAGGVTINLTVQAGMLGQDVPRMTVEALEQAVRRMGLGTVQRVLGIT